jgi:hypothetical protein
LDQGHLPCQDESLLEWACETAIKRPINIYCKSKDCGKRVEGLYFRKYLKNGYQAWLLTSGTDCCTCCDDAFNICLQCVSKGRGCWDLRHTLELAVGTINPLTARLKKPQKLQGLADEFLEEVLGEESLSIWIALFAK